MNSNFWNNIDAKKKDFTTKELEVCELLEKDPFTFATATATEVSKRYNISQSAVSRFCQKIGFTSYSDFRLNLSLATHTTSKAINSTTAEYAAELSNIINQLSQQISDDGLIGLANQIIKSRNTYTSGYGASDTPASLLAFRSMLASVPIYHIHTSKETEMLHIMNSEDTVILFSANNPSHIDFMQTIEELPKEKRPYIILIASSLKHPFAKKVDQIIVLPYMIQFDSADPLAAPQTIQLIFVLFLLNKLYIEVAKSRKENQ